MAQPRVLVLRSPGANCDVETAFAFERAGALADRVHVNRLLEQGQLMRDYQIACVPGGFSYGDDVGAGKVLAAKLQHHLFGELREFHAAGKLLLGICNGFQVLLKSGLLFADPEGAPPATLTWNDNGRYEARWVSVEAQTGQCVFLRGFEQAYLPVAHAEGKFVARDSDALRQLDAQGQVALRYVAPPHGTANGNGHSGTGGASNGGVPFPYNPNGSQGAIAGICDPSGRAFGLMPHPERFIDRTQHPRWTREPVPDPTDGLRLFRNAVEFFA